MSVRINLPLTATQAEQLHDFLWQVAPDYFRENSLENSPMAVAMDGIANLLSQVLTGE